MTDSETASKNNIWLAGSLAGGLIVGVPAGWFLQHLVLLPMFLGMFFFMLFGLLIGAIMFRLGKLAVPAPRRTLWLIGSAVTMVIWSSVLVTEYIELPGKAVQEIRRGFAQPPNKAQLAELHEQTRRNIAAMLEADYYPGGFLGYLRWAATDGTMQCPRVFSDSSYPYRLQQRKGIWVARVILSLILLSFTIQSQLLGLAQIPKEDSDMNNGESVAE